MTDPPTDIAKRPSKTLAYLQLFRLPNVFTAAADILMGYLVVNRSLEPIVTVACLLSASCLLYIAGMVLNDVYDLPVDAKDRPERPLPSGRISVRWARWLGFELLLIGVALGWTAGYAFLGANAMPWRGGLIATLLAVCVVGYDAVLKRTVAGPLAMGCCRALNVLLGMSVAASGHGGFPALLLGFEAEHLLVAAGIGLYVVGLTWFARTEADESDPGQLFAGTAVMVVGIGLLGLLPNVGRAGYHVGPFAWWMLLFLLSVTIVRRCLTAAFRPQPREVQRAVKQAILSLIVLDAAVCLLYRGPYWAVGVLALLAPTVLLGRWLPST